MLWLVVVILLIYFVYNFIIIPFVYWKKQGVVHRKPWPLIGNMAQFVFGIKASEDFFKDIYNEFPENRYMGMHLFPIPVLLIRDPELIKQITIKDFDHFTDHALFRFIHDLDPILSKTLVALTGQQWKETRSTIGPFFTSGKMKYMFPLISECAENYINYLNDTDSDLIQLDLMDVFSRFTSDVIASIAFGIETNSCKEKNNTFSKTGQKFIHVEGLKAVKLMTYVAFPAIARLLNIRVLEKRYEIYYKGLIKKVINLRESSNIVRRDMVQLFLEARKSMPVSNNKDKTILKDLTDDSIIAQALMFFSAGFSNTASTLCFMGYELALNPDIQEKLRNEIYETLDKCNGKVTYEAISKLKYFDMIISETLRKWPPGAVLDRKCVKDYIIPPKCPEEKEILVKKGSFILLPLAAIQHDPKYFSHPARFDPERFSDENKCNIGACTFMPMGVGPRYCVASRFAYMEIKIMFFYLLSKFEIVTTHKTSIPLVKSKLKLNLGSEGGFWLGLKRRIKS